MLTGIVITSNAASGGVYQYTRTLVHALHTAWEHPCKLFVLPECETDFSQFYRTDWKLVVMDAEILLSTRPPECSLTDAMTGDILYGCNYEAYRYFVGHDIDLLIYPSPCFLCFESGIPFIMAVHDLQHRIHPEFPEVSSGGEWGRREYLYRNGIKFAKSVLVDSEVGREDVLNCYQDIAAFENIFIVPFASSRLDHQTEISGKPSILSLRSRYGLMEDYYFYPAQFWAHKNHLRLIKSLAILKKTTGAKVQLVLTGSFNGAPHEQRKEVYENLWQLAYELHVDDMLLYLGYVSDNELQVLYENALALVMPTYFGPTNIPVLEAWEAGCPVITSDIRGVREQAGDGALLVDPNDEEDIAQAMYQVLSDSALRISLKQKGLIRLESFSKELFTERLINAVTHTKNRLTFPSHCEKAAPLSYKKVSSTFFETPVITVITPSFNQAQFLEACIESILSQNYPNLEYIVMDGGSTDGSVEIIKKYEKYLAFWVSMADGGQYRAIQAGFSRSTGEIMTWLNSDDLFCGGAFNTVSEIFCSMPHVEWITGRPQGIDSNGHTLWTLEDLPIWSRSRYLKKLYNSPYIQQEGTFWRRRLWQKAGGYIAKYLELAGDLELWARFFRFSQLHTVDSVLASYRQHPDQKMAQHLAEYNREAEAVLARELSIFGKNQGDVFLPEQLPILIAEDGKPYV